MTAVSPDPVRPSGRPSTPSRRLLVLAGLAVIVVAGILALSTDGAVLRLVAGVAIVLVAGASLVAILRLRVRDRAERTVMVIGLGIAALVIGGLLLDIVTSLSPPAWAGLLAVLIGVAALVRSRSAGQPATVVDRTAVPPDGVDVGNLERRSDDDEGDHDGMRPAPRRSWPILVITGVLCTAAVGVSLSIAVDSARDQSGAGFTALAFDLDGDAPAGERPENLTLVVENRERVSAAYRLVVSAGEETLLEVDDLRLGADEHSSHVVSFDEVESGTRIDARLYRDGGADVYRAVSYTLP